MLEISALIGAAAVTASVIALLVNGGTRLLVEIEKITAFISDTRQLALNRDDRICLDDQASESAVRQFSCESITKAWFTVFILS